MGPNNYCTGISILLMALTASSTTTEHLSRQRGYGLIKFEGDKHTDLNQRQHDTISFREQEHSQENTQPFRFDDIKNYREDPPESHRYPQSDVGVDNPISFGQSNTPNYPEDSINGVKAGFTFQDENVIEDHKVQKKRKKRRRRRPRLQQFPASAAYPDGYPAPGSGYPTGYPTPGSGYPGPRPGYQAPVPGYPDTGSGYPGSGFGYPNSGSGYPTQGFGHAASYGQNPYGNSAIAPGLYRPLRRPRPQSIATDALSTVTRALASIARYDDYQCVPRLLCEVAGGGGALGAGAPGTGAGSGLLQSVAALQPLLTLLTSYNGISSSPLFIFGRAVFLGMTTRGAHGSPGAAATCRYAYPLCPTDPEQLVHYLNNHNGGFFRFFNAPQRPHPQYGLQQNLEQFYNQLASPGSNSGQYGFYQPGESLAGSPGQYGQLGYTAPEAAQGYGLYNNDAPSQQYNPNYQIPAGNGNQNYGATYPYSQNHYGFAKLGFKNNESDLKGVETNKIEKRIQNIKSDEFDEDIFSSNLVDRNKYSASKWLFPNTNSNDDHAHRNEHNRKGKKQLSFPNEIFKLDHSESDVNRKAKGFNFPGPQSNRDADVYAIEATTHISVFPHSYPHDSQTEAPQDESEEGLEVVYIIRGDGDPNNPEIVKLRPGQSIQSIGFL